MVQVTLGQRTAGDRMHDPARAQSAPGPERPGGGRIALCPQGPQELERMVRFFGGLPDWHRRWGDYRLANRQGVPLGGVISPLYWPTPTSANWTGRSTTRPNEVTWCWYAMPMTSSSAAPVHLATPSPAGTVDTQNAPTTEVVGDTPGRPSASRTFHQTPVGLADNSRPQLPMRSVGRTVVNSIARLGKSPLEATKNRNLPTGSLAFRWPCQQAGGRPFFGSRVQIRNGP